MALVRARVSLTKTLHINWSHLWAFLLVVGGALVTSLQAQLQAGKALTWSAAGAALLGAVWLAIQQSILQQNVPPSSFAADGDATIPGHVPDLSKRTERRREHLYRQPLAVAPEPIALVHMRQVFAISFFATLACAFAMFIAGVIVPGCIPNPAQQGSDVVSEITCVGQNWGKPIDQIIAACGPNEAQLVLDAIADLIVIVEHNPGDGGSLSTAAVYLADTRVNAAMPAARARFAAKADGGS